MAKLERYGAPKARMQTALDDKGNAAEIYTHDEYGLALDPAVWAKASGTCCHGRGIIWKKVGEQPQMHPCDCALRRYKRERDAIEVRLLHSENRLKALEDYHRENGHHLVLKPLSLMTTNSNIGSVPDVPDGQPECAHGKVSVLCPECLGVHMPPT